MVYVAYHIAHGIPYYPLNNHQPDSRTPRCLFTLVRHHAPSCESLVTLEVSIPDFKFISMQV